MLSSDLCVAGLIPPPMPPRHLRTSSTCAHYGECIRPSSTSFSCLVCGSSSFTRDAVSISYLLGREIRAKSIRWTPLAFGGCLVCQQKKFGLVLSFFPSWSDFPLAYHVACLLRSLRQCRSHCYGLLDWNAHAHQRSMRAGRSRRLDIGPRL